jgi:DNA-binding SARP family transcriptional activator
MRHSDGTRQNRFGSILGALLALAALLVLLAGIPALLLRYADWPITGVPTGEQIRDLPDTALTDEALFAVLTVALWAAWALFVCSVAVEVVARLQGRRAGVNVGGPLQRLAARLVGSLLLSVGTLGVPVLGSTPGAGASPALAGEVAGQQVPLTALGGQVHVGSVRAAASPAVASTPAAPAVPAVPAVPSAPAQTPPPSGVPSTSVVVQPGDHFWGIAKSTLTERWGREPTDSEMVGYWLDLVEANRHLLLPPHDPNLVYPQQQFNVPPPPPDPVAGTTTPLPPTEPAPTPPPTQPPATPPPTTGDGGSTGGTGTTTDTTGSDESGGTTATTESDDGSGSTGTTESDDGSGSTGTTESDDGSGSTGTTETTVEDPSGDPESIPIPPGGQPDEEDGEQPPATLPQPEATTPEGTGDTAPDQSGDTSGDTTPDETGGTSGDGTVDDGAEGDPQDAEPGTGDEGEPAGEAPPATAGSGSTSREGEGQSEGGGQGTATSLEESDDEGGSSFPVVLVAGGMALAGALVVLERRRRVQQRYRTRGRRIRLPEPSSSLAAAEQGFRQAAQVDRAELVDHAVRAAASRSEAGGLPALRWVEAGDETVTLVLGAPVSPPPGFEWEGRDRWVSTAATDELMALSNGAGTPAPALVPVGTSHDDAEVLVDLEASGLVEVAGPPRQVEAILRSLALAASTSPWAEDAKVRLVGLGAELARHDWVTLVPTLAEALDEAEAQVERVGDALRGLRCQTTREARAVSVNPATWAPLVIVSATPPADADEQRRLERLGDRPDHGVAVVVPATGEGGVTARRIVVGDDGWVSIAGVDPEVRPHGTDEASAGLLADLIDVADDREPVEPTYDEPPSRRPATTATPVVERAGAGRGGSDDVVADQGEAALLVPPDPLATAAAAGADGGNGGLAALMADVDVVVRVLGEVEVVRREGDSWDVARPVDIGRQKAVEAIAYLAMRDTAVEREDLEINLFPDGANATKTVYNIISAARKAVGDDLFPVSDGRRYGLSDRVVTDYALFYELTAQADETDDQARRVDLLAESLDLVMGEPFTGAGRSFSWVGPHRGIIVAQVVDAAEELAELHLEQGDWRAAEWAARKGLRAFPADERMYRILMRTAARSGNIPGVHRVYRELCQVIADPEDGVEPDDAVHPETTDLLEELTGTSSRSAG